MTRLGVSGAFHATRNALLLGSRRQAGVDTIPAGPGRALRRVRGAVGASRGLKSPCPTQPGEQAPGRRTFTVVVLATRLCSSASAWLGVGGESAADEPRARAAGSKYGNDTRGGRNAP